MKIYFKIKAHFGFEIGEEKSCEFAQAASIRESKKDIRSAGANAGNKLRTSSRKSFTPQQITIIAKGLFRSYAEKIEDITILDALQNTFTKSLSTAYFYTGQ